MKKIKLICLLSFFCSSITFAQTPTELLKERQEKVLKEQREYNEGLVDTAHRFFYKTYADYISSKPVQGIKYTGKRKILVGSESVLVLENDEFEYKKIKELKYWGFIDEFGQLERIYDSHCYYVLDTGKICSYLKAIDVEMSTDKNGNIRLNWLSENSSGYKDYISEGLNGDIDVFTEKKFEQLTSSNPEIYQQFMSEPTDNSAKDKRSQKTFKIQKFVHQYNRN
jgi:hypothetical protein